MTQLASPHDTSNHAALPMVRLALLVPFIDELDSNGVNTDALLHDNGLARAPLSDASVFVPVIVIHRFLEEAAVAAGDPFLGVHVGEKLDFGSWSPFVEAVNQSTNLGEFVTRFLQSAQADASSARHTLEIGPEASYFREIRTSEPSMDPAQNDGFTAAYMFRLFRLATGRYWDGTQVRVSVCDPAALPPGYLDATVIGGDRMGVVIRFPTSWLLRAIDHDALAKRLSSGSKRLQLPTDFLDAIRQILTINLHRTDLTVDRVSQQSGCSRQSLQRQLKSRGTTLSAEIARLKKDRAEDWLSTSNRSVLEIANALGYRDSTSFTRAFKAWTGQAPRDYRKRHGNKPAA